MNRFDHIFNIRTLVESSANEGWLGILDMNVFDRKYHFQSNPKSILFVSIH